MDRKQDDSAKSREPKDEIDEAAEKSRRELDEIPPPGTDPLHEGP
jgi:hypothetical protein